LQSSAVAGAALLAGRAVCGQDKPARDAEGNLKKPPFAGFLIGLQSYSLRNYPVETAMQYAADLGFKSIEFYSGQYPINSTPEQISQMNARLQSLGLKCFAHGVNRFGKDPEANRKIFQFAKAAGLKAITADPDPDSFDNLDKLVAEFDIRIAIHNHGPTHRYNKVVDVISAVKSHDPRIGACADLGHYIRSGEDPVQVIRALGDRLYGIHLKDFAEQKDKTKGVILGKGHLDVDGVFRALRQVQFPADGCLSLEYEENPQNPLADVRECLQIAKEAAMKASA
jgi:sugar phosphate isomerase/epimerase